MHFKCTESRGQFHASSNQRIASSSTSSNPLIKQLFKYDHRNFNGHPLFNHEAIALYLKHQFKSRHPQTYALAGSEDLRAVLPHLKLTEEGEKAFILIRPYIHSMALFFFRSEDQTHCYFFDSQNWGERYYPNRRIKQAIEDVIPEVRLHVLKKDIQSQDYPKGCTYYSLAFLDYCAEHLQPEAISAEEFALTVSSPSWVERMHLEKSQVLNDILNAFYHSEKGLDEQKVWTTVKEMQGFDLMTALAVDLRPMYPFNFEKDNSTLRLTVQFPDKDGVYGNFLLYSAKVYPGGVNVEGGNSSILLSDGEGITATYDPKNYRIIYEVKNLSDKDKKDMLSVEAENLSTLRNALETLRSNCFKYFKKGMRQQTALMTFCEEVIDQIILQEMKLSRTSGGLGLDQVQAALSSYFAENKKVYVPAYADYINLKLLDWNHLRTLGVESVIFSFTFDDKHQVAVCLDLRQQEMIARIYDSYEKEITEDNKTQLKALLEMQELDIVKGDSPYLKQTDNWSCGIYVIENLRHAVSGEEVESQTRLKVKDLLADHYQRAKRWSRFEEKKHEQRENNFQIKQTLLRLIEHYRVSKGFFSSSESTDEDVFKPVADALQQEIWGNLNRQQDPEINSDRTSDSSYWTKSRSIDELFDSYNEGDRIGRALLYAAYILKNDSSFKERMEGLLILLAGLKARNRGTKASKTDGTKYTNIDTRIWADTLKGELGLIEDADELTGIFIACLDQPFLQVLELINDGYLNETYSLPLKKADFLQLQQCVIVEVLSRLPALSMNMENKIKGKSVESAAYQAKKNALCRELKKKLEINELPDDMNRLVDRAPEYINTLLIVFMKPLNPQESRQFMESILKCSIRVLTYEKLRQLRLPINVLLKIWSDGESISVSETIFNQRRDGVTLFEFAKEDKNTLNALMALIPHEELQSVHFLRYFKLIVSHPNMVQWVLSSMSPQEVFNFFVEIKQGGKAAAIVSSTHCMRVDYNFLIYYPKALVEILRHLPVSRRLDFLLVEVGFKPILEYILPDAESLREAFSLLSQQERYKLVQADIYHGEPSIYSACNTSSFEVLFDPSLFKNFSFLVQLLNKNDSRGYNFLSSHAGVAKLLNTVLACLSQEQQTEILFSNKWLGKELIENPGQSGLKLILHALPDAVRAKYIFERLFDRENHHYNSCYMLAKPKAIDLILNFLSAQQCFEFLSQQDAAGNTLLHYLGLSESILLALKAVPVKKLPELLRLTNDRGESVFYRIRLRRKSIEYIAHTISPDIINEQLIPEAFKQLKQKNQEEEHWNEICKAIDPGHLNPSNYFTLMSLATSIEFFRRFQEDGLLYPLLDGKFSLIEFNQMKTVEQKKLKFLFSPSIQQAMDNEGISLQQMMKQSLTGLQSIMDSGLGFVRSGRLTLRQLISFEPHKLPYALSEYGLLALQEELLTLEQMEDISVDKLFSILTESGLKALREKLIDLDQIKKIDTIILDQILTEPGLRALRNKLIPMDQVEHFPVTKWYKFLDDANLQELYVNKKDMMLSMLGQCLSAEDRRQMNKESLEAISSSYFYNHESLFEGNLGQNIIEDYKAAWLSREQLRNSQKTEELHTHVAASSSSSAASSFSMFQRNRDNGTSAESMRNEPSENAGSNSEVEQNNCNF